MRETQSAPLPYAGAPRDKCDIIKQQAQFDEQFFPHIIYVHSDEALRKELPTGRRNAVTRNWLLGNIMRYMMP